MGATKESAARVAAMLKEKHGEDYFKKIGSKGGKHDKPRSFETDRELAARAGAIGGKAPKRKGKRNVNE